MSSPLSPPQLILASRSPRRLKMLRQIGLRCRVRAATAVDETPRQGEPPHAHVQRLALAKASEVAARFPRAFVLGADTIVVLEGRLLGKPRDAADAAAMLRLLSGRTHVVYTGLALLRADPAVQEVAYAATRVTFRTLHEEEVLAYVATGEPLDKAGAYGIQGRAALFVERIDGCYANVVGLPLALLAQLLQRVGVRWWSHLLAEPAT
ncbi:MAG: septum formation inhibitor Maf [Candidatus Tectomicrobia bacterium]|nr:septum formation inhibitor Maf [Candidatus Tectomicrobia bacterium]